MTSSNSYDVIILGAGVVGVCSALSCLKNGLKVCLVDRKPPGSETSYGNAGVLSPSSALPFNNPMLWRSLPGIIRQQHLGASYDKRYLLSNISTFARFLFYANKASTLRRANHLDPLITRSIQLHKNLLDETNQRHRLRETGWFKVYRSNSSFLSSAYERDVYRQLSVRFDELDSEQIYQLEPNLQTIYKKGVLIKDAVSVDNPGDIVQIYADRYVADGGQLLTMDIDRLEHKDSQWIVFNKENEKLKAKQVLVALGPWSKQFLSKLNIKLPMFFERGAHRVFNQDDQINLNRPIFDVDGAFVASPMTDGIRVTSGVQLRELNTPFNKSQLDGVETNVRQAIKLAGKQTYPDWIGSRPSLPDSMPVIGESHRRGLWLNTGHQHIGFSTAPASGELLVKLLAGEVAQNNNPFSYARF